MLRNKAFALTLLATATITAVAACADSATAPRSASVPRHDLIDPVDDDTAGGGGVPSAQSCNNPSISIRRHFSQSSAGQIYDGATASVVAGQLYDFYSTTGCPLGSWKADTSVVKITLVSDTAHIQVKKYDPSRTNIGLSYVADGRPFSATLYASPPTLTLTGNDRVVAGGTSTLKLQAWESAVEEIPAAAWPSRPVVTSGSTAILTASESGGAVTVGGVSQGSSYVNATFLGRSTSKTITVVPATGVTVTVTPSVFRATAPGKQVQFSATATDAAGNPVNGTRTWASDNTAVATVDSNGLVSLVGYGTARITASVGGSSGTGTVLVNRWCFDCP